MLDPVVAYETFEVAFRAYDPRRVNPHTEPVPPIDDSMSEVHATFLCRNGVYIIVNVNLSGLAERKAWRFALCCTPIPFVGAQGSPARPFAVL